VKPSKDGWEWEDPTYLKKGHLAIKSDQAPSTVS
jgi:hypothetical protein